LQSIKSFQDQPQKEKNTAYKVKLQRKEVDVVINLLLLYSS